jgi:hypothetical protein
MIQLRTYLLVFDSGKNPYSVEALHQYIKDSKDIVGYWNHIPLVYAVKSYRPISELREKLRALLPGGSYLLADITGSSIDGYLPREAWDWFQFNHAAGLSNPTAILGTPAGALGLLGALGIAHLAGGDPENKE